MTVHFPTVIPHIKNETKNSPKIFFLKTFFFKSSLLPKIYFIMYLITVKEFPFCLSGYDIMMFKYILQNNKLIFLQSKLQKVYVKFAILIN